MAKAEGDGGKLTWDDAYFLARDVIAGITNTKVVANMSLADDLGFKPAGLLDLVGRLTTAFHGDDAFQKILENLAFSSQTRTVGDLAQCVWDSLPDDVKEGD